MFFRRETSLAPSTLFGLAAVVLLAVGAPPTVFCQTTSIKAKVALRAVTRDDIAAYKLPSTTQTSGGLDAIGLGQPAHIELLLDKTVPAADIVSATVTIDRKPDTSKAVVEESLFPATVPTYEPADRQDYQIAARVLLRPDVGGVYMLTAKIQTKAGSLSLPITITAGEYVGSKQCETCHSGGGSQPWSMGNTWAKTAHASLFKDGVNGVASDHYAASCISCHTVGYDTDARAVNGGFDDVAKRLNWVFPTEQKPGTFEAMPEALKNVANIQCENCHGPGSRHVSSGGDPRLIAKSTTSGACGQCHGALTHHSKSGEWNNSAHAVATRDAAGTGREGCVGCHTGSGFMDRIAGVKTPRTAYDAISCQSCHESHGDTMPASSANLLRTVDKVTLQDGTVVASGGKGTLCMNCHQSRQNASVYAETAAGSARFGPHHGPQGDMLAGANGYTYGKNIPSSAHGLVVEDTCAGCHMQTVDAASPTLTQAGGHTFRIRSEPDKDGNTTELVGACQKCHGNRLTTFNFALLDYDNDGEVEGVQTEIQHLLDQLSALLPPLGQSKSALTIDATWTRPQLKAAYNWQFVKEDGSYGVHNMAYAAGLLKASIADLKAGNK